MKTKTFDCVEMKQRGAEEVQTALTGLTPEEELAFWQRGTAELERRQVEVRTARRPDAPAAPDAAAS